MQTLSKQHISNSIQLKVANPGDSMRKAVEQFIKNKFSAKYDANLAVLPNKLVYAKDVNDEIVGAFSITSAAHRTLYVEQYLDDHIETLCSKCSEHHVTREEIVEVGSLALASKRWFVPIMLQALQHPQLRSRWAIFTATRGIASMLNREKIYPLALGVADPNRLSVNEDNDWGTYYQHNPCVYTISLNKLRHYYRRHY